MRESKIAAIWARVSDPKQEDPSLDTQVERVRDKLESEGYTINHVLKRVWTSTDLKPCPEFQQLARLVLSEKIHAVGMLDRDRIQADGLQRLIFLGECKEHGVRPIVCQGPPFLEGTEGQLVELALAMGKDTLFGRVSYPLTDLTEVALNSIVNVNDPSTILNPWVLIDLFPAVKLTLTLYVPVGDEQSQNGKFGVSGFARIKIFF